MQGPGLGLKGCRASPEGPEGGRALGVGVQGPESAGPEVPRPRGAKFWARAVDRALGVGVKGPEGLRAEAWGPMARRLQGPEELSAPHGKNHQIKNISE